MAAEANTQAALEVLAEYGCIDAGRANVWLLDPDLANRVMDSDAAQAVLMEIQRSNEAIQAHALAAYPDPPFDFWDAPDGIAAKVHELRSLVVAGMVRQCMQDRIMAIKAALDA